MLRFLSFRKSSLVRGTVLLTVLSFVAAGGQAQKFVATGTMQVPRYGHTAVLLRNGEVLLAGGTDGKTLLSSAELYDPHDGAFRLTGSMQTARRDAAGALLPDGEALIAGGHDAAGKPLLSAEIYDPESGSFHPTGDLADPLDSIVAYRLKDGDVAVLGKSGCSTTQPVCTDSVEIYDAWLGSFIRAVDLPQGSGSWGFGTAQLKDDEILVIGGYLPVGTAATLSAELVNADHRSSTFTNGQTAVDETLPATVTLPDGTVLIAGGTHHSGPATISELYHPDSGTFILNGYSNTERLQHLTLLHDGNVLATGGGAISNTAELYSPANHSFQQIGPMLAGHYGATATLLDDGRVLIAGGAYPDSNPPFGLIISQPSAELFLPPLWFDIRAGATENQVSGGTDWTAFTIYADGTEPDGTTVSISCWAAHLDCYAYPDDIKLGGKTYVLVHGLSVLAPQAITVWVKGQAAGETRMLQLTIVKE